MLQTATTLEPSYTMLKTMKEEEKSRELPSSGDQWDSEAAAPAGAAFGGASVLAAVVLMQGGLPSLADAISFDASNFLFFLK